jgi:hypothetical protein
MPKIQDSFKIFFFFEKEFEGIMPLKSPLIPKKKRGYETLTLKNG